MSLSNGAFAFHSFDTAQTTCHAFMFRLDEDDASSAAEDERIKCPIVCHDDATHPLSGVVIGWGHWHSSEISPPQNPASPSYGFVISDE